MQTPILLRLAFHDAGTYNVADGSGGPNASLRYELSRVHNRASVRRFGWPLILRVCFAPAMHDCTYLNPYRQHCALYTVCDRSTVASHHVLAKCRDAEHPCARQRHARNFTCEPASAGGLLCSRWLAAIRGNAQEVQLSADYQAITALLLQIQEALRGSAAQTFSLADIIALAPAYGLSQLGGGSYNLPVGRLDATSEDPDVNQALPDTSDNLSELKMVRVCGCRGCPA